MTCDGCCFGHRAHFCLVPAFLYVLVRCSVDSVLCFDDVLAHNFFISSSSLSFLFAFASAFLLLPAIFVPCSFTLA